ncbi:hypothetical protein CRG98_014876 [Punica granatum]|uniref:Uncharacterized protein n=1 Tax=Punica granatum TaxID=22663 RepID=A0A2I0K890_PUNGR|nr:hypothetical protein CRG98_014876 [Punica granatum]
MRVDIQMRGYSSPSIESTSIGEITRVCGDEVGGQGDVTRTDGDKVEGQGYSSSAVESTSTGKVTRACGDGVRGPGYSSPLIELVSIGGLLDPRGQGYSSATVESMSMGKVAQACGEEVGGRGEVTQTCGDEVGGRDNSSPLIKSTSIGEVTRAYGNEVGRRGYLSPMIESGSTGEVIRTQGDKVKGRVYISLAVESKPVPVGKIASANQACERGRRLRLGGSEARRVSLVWGGSAPVQGSTRLPAAAKGSEKLSVVWRLAGFNKSRMLVDPTANELVGCVRFDELGALRGVWPLFDVFDESWMLIDPRGLPKHYKRRRGNAYFKRGSGFPRSPCKLRDGSRRLVEYRKLAGHQGCLRRFAPVDRLNKSHGALLIRDAHQFLSFAEVKFAGAVPWEANPVVSLKAGGKGVALRNPYRHSSQSYGERLAGSWRLDGPRRIGGFNEPWRSLFRSAHLMRFDTVNSKKHSDCSLSDRDFT